jgi:hypothetical protein
LSFVLPFVIPRCLFVIPAKAGTQRASDVLLRLCSRFRGNDEIGNDEIGNDEIGNDDLSNAEKIARP